MPSVLLTDSISVELGDDEKSYLVNTVSLTPDVSKQQAAGSILPNQQHTGIPTLPRKPNRICP
ncbi:hypothetical protein E2C01_019006 [Portunus trituberculatus]|uniref:Uncharacterized protein n=1 Tax=Portunus trituberculatus TaxID=210409 RepID=A0A5B7DY35_PORTR|nr:hypothetical protein [Portunus trituberculatus]